MALSQNSRASCAVPQPSPGQFCRPSSFVKSLVLTLRQMTRLLTSQWTLRWIDIFLIETLQLQPLQSLHSVMLLLTDFLIYSSIDKRAVRWFSLFFPMGKIIGRQKRMPINLTWPVKFMGVLISLLSLWEIRSNREVDGPAW